MQLRTKLVSAIGTFAAFIVLTSAACAAPVVVNPDRAVVISGVIASNNLRPLGDRLMQYSIKDPKAPVDIVIDSPGGSIVTGFLFINQLEAVRANGTTVRCFVPTIAASMAFQILVHCDERYTLDHAFLLWHRARVTGGDAPMTGPMARELARDLETIDATIFRETNDALDDVDESIVRYHFERETLHTGAELGAMAPGFIKSVPAVRGISEAMNRSLKSSPPGMFGNTFTPGQIIYLAPAEVMSEAVRD